MSIRFGTLLKSLATALLIAASTFSVTARELRVLSIGNSFSTDAFGYLPWIIRSMAPDVDVTMGILCGSGTGLQWDWDRGVTAGNPFRHYFKTTNFEHWEEPYPEYSAGIRYAVRSEPWDFIILQQVSAESRDYSLYQPYLDNLIEWIDENAKNPDKKYIWMLTPAYADGYHRLPDGSSLNMFNDVAACAQHVIDETPIDIIMPCGTGIQNARASILDAMGEYGHMSKDGMHLQEGLPCLIETWIAAMTILDQMGIEYDLWSEDLEISNTWLREIWRPDRRGFIHGVGERSRKWGKICALDAMQHPYERTIPVWPLPEYTEPEDVNEDGEIDGADLNIVISTVLGRDNNGNADVNCDGTIDGKDINLLINLILGK